MADMKNIVSIKQNIDDFEKFYSILDDSHSGLTRDESNMLNSQLILLLANHIGDVNVLRDLFAQARVKVEIIRSNQIL